MNTSLEVLKALEKAAVPGKKEGLARFFKTGKGEYGEGDLFIGVMVPQTRKIAREFKNLPYPEIEKLLKSPYHEARLVALFILIIRHKKDPEKVYSLYLSHIQHINNWDLVDLSAPHIIGSYLLDKDISLLRKLAVSTNVWERRIAMISTFAFIYKGKCREAVEIATLLVNDSHDLIQKAVGWMLREMGKRANEEELLKFLELHAGTMPRTALRYAIERLTQQQKAYFMSRKNKKQI